METIVRESGDGPPLHTNLANREITFDGAILDAAGTMPVRDKTTLTCTRSFVDRLWHRRATGTTTSADGRATVAALVRGGGGVIYPNITKKTPFIRFCYYGNPYTMYKYRTLLSYFIAVRCYLKTMFGIL